MAKRIHIVISDPSPIVRCGIVTLLQRSSSINADIAEVRDLSVVLSESYGHTIDLLIVNPSQMGLFSPAQLKSNLGNSELKIVALQSSFIDQAQLQSYDEVLSIYDSVESITDKVVKVTECEDEEAGSAKRDLSQREQEIIVCVVKGMTNKQIADELFLSAHTVISHRRNIANKLQIHSPAGLTIYAIVNKLVDLSEIKNTIPTSV